jgi:hypothetical protein
MMASRVIGTRRDAYQAVSDEANIELKLLCPKELRS